MYYGNNNGNNFNGGNNNRYGGQPSPNLSNMILNNNNNNRFSNVVNNNNNANINRFRANNNYSFTNTNMNNTFANRGNMLGRYDAQTIIKIINDTVERQFHERVTGKEVTELLEKLEKDGYIKIIGKGTNRTVFEFVIDDRQLKQVSGINVNEPMVYKVPIQVALGRVANNREALTTSILNRYLDDPKMSNLPELRESLVYLVNVLPFKTILPNTNILAITKGIPIEFSSRILELAREQNVQITSSVAGDLRAGDSDFQVKSGIGNVIRNYIVHDETGNKMARKLLNDLNKFFVVADMNPDFSPFNFGFINVNGKLFLTSLDLGAALPRVKNTLGCPKCGSDLIPVYPWDEVIDQSERNILKTEGMFRCTNENCNHGRPSYYKDTDVIEMVRQNIIEDIMKTGQNYDIIDKI